MSMIFGMVGLTPEQIASLRNTPSLATDVLTIAREDSGVAQRGAMLNRLPPEKRAQAEERFKLMESNPRYQEAKKEIDLARERLASFGTVEPALDLQKSWHILHYIFTGNIGPAGSPGDALMTGEDIGGDTAGYGPPRLLGPDATQTFANFLESLRLDELLQRVNYQEMSHAGVYSMPMGGDSDSGYTEDLRREVTSYFPLLRDYVSRMSARRHGLLMWLT